MKRTSCAVTHNPRAKPFAEFVRWCVESRGRCAEQDVLAFICDSYKREYVIRYGAKDVARTAARGGGDLEHNPAARFLNGIEITEQQAELLYSRGLRRLFNDLRYQCKRKRKSVSYCDQTKTFVPVAGKECNAT